jgi:FkbM family methyltransferase
MTSLHQWISDKYFSAIQNEQKWIEIILRQMRKGWLYFSDPEVEVRVYNTKMLLPFSHELPKYIERHPLYMTNLLRLSGLVEQKYGALPAVDIGANVGDTVVVIRQQSNLPVLCIEGNPLYIPYLEKNTACFDQIAIAPFYVGEEDQAAQHKVINEGGTAKLVTSKGGSRLNFKPLSEIYREAGFVERVALLKVDTDGFDIKILLGSTQFLRDHKPVLFFEYDPHLFLKDTPGAHLELFQILTSAGYSKLLEFDNLGNYKGEILVQNVHAFIALTEQYAHMPFGNFCDLAIFHADDSDLCEALKLSYK